jgi:1-acyl-sn-glycerol-3-phosphate acyltransferase
MALLWSLGVIDPLIILSTVFFGMIAMVVMLFDKTGDKSMPLAQFWARTICFFTRTRIEVEGLEKLDPNSNYVLCANHLSYMDTPVVLSRIHVQFRFMAKSELFEIPFMGTHLKQAGHVPVILDDARAAIRTLSHAAQMVHQRKISLLIFPEGGRSEDGLLQPFKEGAAYLAIKAQVPIVPMALIGTREILPMHGKVFRPGLVRLRIGEPISTEGLALRNREGLTNQLRERIVELLEG